MKNKIKIFKVIILFLIVSIIAITSHGCSLKKYTQEEYISDYNFLELSMSSIYNEFKDVVESSSKKEAKNWINNFKSEALD